MANAPNVRNVNPDKPDKAPAPAHGAPKVAHSKHAKRWDVASMPWSRVVALLDEGWEPFAVVQREPITSTSLSEPHVYLRRERRDQ